MKELTCIICPRGCRLTIDENNNVNGNTCPRGKAYAISEITNPMRTITSIIRVNNIPNMMVSVKTDKPVPKAKMMDVMNEINKVSVAAPTYIGQIVIENVLGLGANIIITKNQPL